MTLIDKENRTLAEQMLKESQLEKRQRENDHRALPDDEQPYMVVCFGMLSYRVIWVAPDGSSESKKIAEQERDYWAALAKRKHLAVLPLSRNVDPGDFQVRQQWDLDALKRAIIGSYE